MQPERITTYIDNLQSRGKYTFTLNDVRRVLNRSDAAVKAALFRTVRKGQIVAVRKGFYVIVTPEYRIRGIAPPVLFIDDLMHYLDRAYYISLLSAAALHGSAHQQPQDFFVTTSIPALRTISAKGTKIRFMSRRRMPTKGIKTQKTDTGTVRVATPELTALDCILFEKRIGGLGRAVEVIDGLIESVDPEIIGGLSVTNFPISVTQRLGYIIEQVIGNASVANALFEALRHKPFFSVPLSTDKSPILAYGDNRWKVRVNDTVDIDI